MGVWFILLMEKIARTCCEIMKKFEQWAMRHICCTVLIAWVTIANWDIWLAYTATPIRCAILGDDRMQVFVTKEEWQRLYPNPINIPEGEHGWIPANNLQNDLDEETKAKYPKEIEYKWYTYELDFVSRKYPNLVKYSYFDWDSNYFENHSTLYYDNVKDKLIGVSYIIRGRYKIPIYDGYHTFGCDLTEDWKDELRDYINTY